MAGFNQGLESKEEEKLHTRRHNSSPLCPPFPPTLPYLIQYDKRLEETWRAGCIILPYCVPSLSPQPLTSFLYTLQVPRGGDVASRPSCVMFRSVCTALRNLPPCLHTLMDFSSASPCGWLVLQIRPLRLIGPRCWILASAGILKAC